MNSCLTIGIVAGEVSGDALGADFIHQMHAICPNVRWVGVGGERMQKAGLVCVADMARLSVMGTFEVVKHLPDLLSAKREILSAFEHHEIDIFVGIDALDFNLRLGKVLKPKGIFCVQMVSPSIWAWRENRIHGIKAATDLVLCLFPFELPIYAKHQHPAVCIGHPLIKSLRPKGLIRRADTLCLMAGSRMSKIHAILPVLLASFGRLYQLNPSLKAILPLAKTEHHAAVDAIIELHAPHLTSALQTLTPKDWQASTDFDANYTASQYAMQISTLTILASGTATLEALMLPSPMIVVYKINALTYFIAKRLVKTPYVALPNILATQSGPAIVPELIQKQATPTHRNHRFGHFKSTRASATAASSCSNPTATKPVRRCPCRFDPFSIKHQEVFMTAHTKDTHRHDCVCFLHKNYPAESTILTIGVDEVGRGSLFGQMTVAAVILDDETTGEFDVVDLTGTPIASINDSKKLSAKKRTTAHDAIKQTCQSYAIVDIPAHVIDEIDIHQATLLGMRLAIESLIQLNDIMPYDAVVIIDGNTVPILSNDFVHHQDNLRALVKGDGIHTSVACASILAKVHRDAAMDRFAQKYLHYLLDKNKGYPSKAHTQAIFEHGILPEHRKSFNPIRTLLMTKRQQEAHAPHGLTHTANPFAHL
ncbi:Lipid-A-disaccharide synthase [Moraxella ovis]|nr:Lipid-A-disaccharide synthase [Moraxella ovis]STZ06866.1 Lipid-A-disaccharide synthase [Moraxella ovis]